MYPARTKYHSQDYADHYAGARFAKRVSDRELRMVRSLLDRCGPVARALDAPCGTGRICSQLPELSIVGCDLSAQMLERAATDPHVLGVRGDVEHLPFGDGAFDLVLSIRFLHHLTSVELLERCLKELARVSSRYVLVTYFRTLALQHLRRKLRFWRAPSHRQAVSASTFRKAASVAGLKVVATRCSAPLISEQWFVLLERDSA